MIPEEVCCLLLVRYGGGVHELKLETRVRTAMLMAGMHTDSYADVMTGSCCAY